MVTRETVATFLPGAAGLGGFWSPVIERLPPTWRTQAVDLPGLGPVPPHPAVTGYDSLVDHVARALSSPTVLVVQSMGGYVALQLALRYPQIGSSVRCARHASTMATPSSSVRRSLPRCRRHCIAMFLIQRWLAAICC